MIPRIDASLEDVPPILERYGYASIQTRYLGPIQPYLPDTWAAVELDLAWTPGAPKGDPWAVRRWQQERVRACLAELQAAGWYLHSRLDIEHSSRAGGDEWTLNGDCVTEPQQSQIACKARFAVIGFPPKQQRKAA